MTIFYYLEPLSLYVSLFLKFLFVVVALFNLGKFKTMRFWEVLVLISLLGIAAGVCGIQMVLHTNVGAK
jgi:hypothetical protein